MSPQQSLDAWLAGNQAQGASLSEEDIRTAAAILGYDGDLSAEYRLYARDYVHPSSTTAPAVPLSADEARDERIADLAMAVYSLIRGDIQTAKTYCNAVDPDRFKF